MALGEAVQARGQEQRGRVGVSIRGRLDLERPPGQALHEQFQHMLDFLQRHAVRGLGGFGGEGLQLAEGRATGIKPLFVVHVHGLDDPGLDRRQRHEAEGLRRARGELVGHLGVGLDDDVHPVQHEILLRALQFGQCPGQRRRGAARGQHRVERLVEARFQFGDGERLDRS